MPVEEFSVEDMEDELQWRRKAREEGAEYRHYVSGLIPAAHSRLIWKYLHRIMDGKSKRLMVFCPPGSAKTLDISHHFPAFYLSKFQKRSIIAATHTDKFSETNGRRVRNIIMSDEHKTLFPEIQISEDSSAAARWETNQGGIYMGFGVGATVIGRRAHGLILDDVVAGVAAADSATDRDFVWNWFGGDLSTRLVPGGFIILVMTRYHLDDIAGRLLAASKTEHGDKWEVLSLPALAKDADPLGRKPGEPLWPEWQNKKELERIKAQPSMSTRMFSALYQQEPVAESGNIVKRNWIKIWPHQEPPKCEFILQSYDTAVSKKATAAYSVCQTWGVFKEPERDLPAMILLARWRERVEYPDLRKMAIRLNFNFLDDRRDMPMKNPAQRSPDLIIVEGAPVGKPLIQDLRNAGVSVSEFPAQRYGSKESRLRLSLDLLENGRVWVPGLPPNFTQPRRFAEEWIQSMISWPSGDSMDDCDAFSQCAIRLRTSGWVRNADDPDYSLKPYTSERRSGAIY